MASNPEYFREWRRKNKEKIRAYNEANKERRRMHVREWQKRNPEKVKEWRLRDRPERIIYLRRWRKEHKEEIRAYHKANNRGYNNAQQRAIRQYRKRNPLKVECRFKFRNAVAAGKIVRPNECSKCGKPCRPEGHHPDYSKPFEVIWLCKSCHVVTHYGE